MKIHTDIIAELETFDIAARKAGVRFLRLYRKNSTVRRYGYDVVLTGTGRHGGQYGGVEGKTATWDEWGIFLAELYRHDPAMACGNPGKPVYADGSHFAWATDNRFDDLKREDQHWAHRWDDWWFVESDVYTARRCRCGAMMRWLHRMPWSEYARS